MIHPINAIQAAASSTLVALAASPITDDAIEVIRHSGIGSSFTSTILVGIMGMLLGSLMGIVRLLSPYTSPETFSKAPDIQPKLLVYCAGVSGGSAFVAIMICLSAAPSDLINWATLATVSSVAGYMGKSFLDKKAKS